MRSNALKKQDDYAQDNVKPAHESWELRRLHIARQVEEACHLPGNSGSCDMEEFLLKYDMRKSDFA